MMPILFNKCFPAHSRLNEHQSDLAHNRLMSHPYYCGTYVIVPSPLTYPQLI